MNIVSIINSKYDSLSKSEKRIADYFLSDNLSYDDKCNISDLSETISVGQATILRFVKKLGFNNYAEFKIKLKRELSSKKIEMENNSQYQNKLIDAIETLKGQIDEAEFIEAAKFIYDSEYVYLYGLGYSRILAELISYQLFRYGKKTHIISENHEFQMAISSAKGNESFVIISRSGTTKEINDLCKDLKDSSVRFIGITENKDSNFAKLATHLMQIPSLPKYPDSIGVMSLFIQTGVLELWFRYYKEIDEESITRTQDRITAAIAEHNSELQ